MPDKTFAIYLGPNNSQIEASFVMTDSFFCVLEINPQNATQPLREITSYIQKQAEETILENPKDMFDFCTEFVRRFKLQSLSAGFLTQNQIYTYVHQGTVLLSRKSNLYQASLENQAIAGEFAARDHYLLLTKNTLTQPHLKTIIAKNNDASPKELSEHFRKELSPDQPGAILFVSTHAPHLAPEKNVPISSSEAVSIPTPTSPTNKLSLNLPLLMQNKYLRLGVALIILGLILFKTVLVIQSSLVKRKETAYAKNYQTISRNLETLKENLNQNPTSSIKKIEPLLATANKLKNDYPEKKTAIDELIKEINQLKQTYGHANSSKASLFYDLKLIDKKAEASIVSYTEKYAEIIDLKNSKAYLLNLENKDYEDFSLDNIKDPSLITEYNQTLYVYSSSGGIYKEENNKFKRIVTPDNWGKVVDFKIFNSNLYLLSTTKDEIYKFTPTEDGYSSKISYLTSDQAQDLSTARGLAIDFSVYVLSNNLWKYTAGSRASFSPSSQLDYGKMTALYKTESNNFLYLLDPVNKRIVALNKEGKLERSIFNNQLHQTQTFGVINDDKIIFLNATKLYQLDNF